MTGQPFPEDHCRPCRGEEAVTFGEGSDGSDLFVAGNNFSKDQKTQFIAFKVIQRP